MRRLSALGLVVVLVGAVALLSPAMAGAQGANTSNQGQQAAFSETQFVLTVYENGSARWTQRYNQPLTNETQIQRFRAYADRFNGEETPVYEDFKQRATELTGAGSNATGREMEARGFARDARVTSQPTATGVVEMSFVWTNATAVENGRVVLGDTFENGLYLSSGMSLEIRAGPNVDIAWESVEPTPDASTNGSGNETDSLTYFGEQRFAGGHPHVAFPSESSVVANGSSAFGVGLLWGAGALVLALVIGAVVIRRSGRTLSRTTDDETTGETAATTGTTATDTGDGTDTAETTGAADANTGDAEGPTPPEPAVAEAALESDADRVATLLEANGGRMQQGTIVEETGWSKSKVSMLLSEMETDGRISKLRVGRKNIVSLTGHEPEAAQSPFEDG